MLHATHNPTHSFVKKLVRSKVVSGVTFPLVGVGLYIVTVVATHLTSFMNLVLTHPVLHDAEHGIYLLVGYLYFLPLIGREPIKWRLSFPTKLFLLIHRDAGRYLHRRRVEPDQPRTVSRLRGPPQLGAVARR